MGLWQGMTMYSVKFHPGPPCPTLLHPAGGIPLRLPYDRFWGGPPAGRGACGRPLPFWTPHAARLCLLLKTGLFIVRREEEKIKFWHN
jgi:hypothetical protein